MAAGTLVLLLKGEEPVDDDRRAIPRNQPHVGERARLDTTAPSRTPRGEEVGRAGLAVPLVRPVRSDEPRYEAGMWTTDAGST
jgi:hypothetical protein